MIWGTTYLGIRVALEAVPPALMGAFRWMTAGSLLIAYVRLRRQPLPHVREWGSLAIQGLLMIGFGIGFGRRSVPITDGAFTFDENLGNTAYHLAGTIGRLQGQGTLSVVWADLTDDEQAQICTTGDLTWTVEFVRRI